MRRERFGDASEEAGLVGDVDDVRPGLRTASRSNNEDTADRGPQLLDCCCRGVEPAGSDDRERDPIETSPTRVRQAFGDLRVIAAAFRQLCEPGSERCIPTNDHDTAAHGATRVPSRRRTIRRADDCYQIVTRR